MCCNKSNWVRPVSHASSKTSLIPAQTRQRHDDWAGATSAMRNMRLTVSFQTHGRRARRASSRFSFTARRAPGPAHSIFSSGSHFYCRCDLFLLHRALFFHQPALIPFPPSPPVRIPWRRFFRSFSFPAPFFPPPLARPLSHSSLHPSASPHPLPCLYLKRITGLEQSSIWNQHQ